MVISSQLHHDSARKNRFGTQVAWQRTVRSLSLGQRWLVLALVVLVATGTVQTVIAQGPGLSPRVQTPTNTSTTVQNNVSGIASPVGDTATTLVGFPSFTSTGSEATLTTLVLPPGSYVFMVTVAGIYYAGQGTRSMQCLIEKPGGAALGLADFDISSATQTLSFHGVGTLTAAEGSVSLRCSRATFVGAHYAQLTAIPVSLSFQ